MGDGEALVASWSTSLPYFTQHPPPTPCPPAILETSLPSPSHPPLTLNKAGPLTEHMPGVVLPMQPHESPSKTGKLRPSTAPAVTGSSSTGFYFLFYHNLLTAKAKALAPRHAAPWVKVHLSQSPICPTKADTPSYCCHSYHNISQLRVLCSQPKG